MPSFSADEAEVIIKGENKVMCEGTAHFEIVVKKVDLSRWSIQWQKRRGMLTEHIDIRREKYSGSTYEHLVIQSVCKEDEGEYQAVISKELKGNECKRILSNRICLHVLGGTIIIIIIIIISIIIIEMQV